MDEIETDRLARRLEQRAQRLGERRTVEPAFGELVDNAVRRLMTAIIVAGGLIGLGLYASKPETPKFQAFAAPNGQIIRVGLQSGTVLACEGRTCMTVVRRGQTLQRTLPSMEAPPPAPAQRALPAPATAPAQRALPAPAPATAPAQGQGEPAID